MIPRVAPAAVLAESPATVLLGAKRPAEQRVTVYMLQCSIVPPSRRHNFISKQRAIVQY
jgi:hypothetical protein